MDKIKYLPKPNNHFVDVALLNEINEMSSGMAQEGTLSETFEGKLDALIFSNTDGGKVYAWCARFRVPVIKFIEALKNPQVSFKDCMPTEVMPIGFRWRRPSERIRNVTPEVAFYENKYLELESRYHLLPSEKLNRCPVCRVGGTIIAVKHGENHFDELTTPPKIITIPFCPHNKHKKE